MNKKVEIYTIPSCAYCKMSKEFFKQNNIPYDEYDVATDAAKRQEMIDKTGQMGVPVIVIDDKDIVVGFDRDKLSELLNL